jgi:O-antigen/teichoic acid export membrane protein
MSAWLTGGLVLSNVLLSSDVVILGWVVSPAVVTTYVLTGAAARMAVSLFNFTVGATTPGLGGLIGEGRFDRAAVVRAELASLTWLFVTAAGAAILLWNRSFVALWVGAEHYAGVWVNLLVVCLMAQTAFIRGDGFIIDAALRPRPRVMVTALAAVITLAATLVLTPRLGIVGLCLGALGGRLVQTIAYPILASSFLRQGRALPLARVARPLIVMTAIFAAATFLSQRVSVGNWMEWAGAVALTGASVLALAAVAGLPSHVRRPVLERFLRLKGSFRV